MTNEEAIRYCDEYLARHISDIDKEFLKKVKEALQQEPCSNCCNGNQIEKAKLCQKSYLAGMEHKQEPCDKCVYSTSEGCQYDDTPQQNIGYWIDEKDGYGTRCSKCKKWYPHSIITKHEVLYCSSCGAKMQEVKDNG